MWRMHTYGLLDDHVLAVNVEKFLERLPQTLVLKAGLAKSIHHARVLLTQRHISVVLNLFPKNMRTAVEDFQIYDGCFNYQLVLDSHCWVRCQLLASLSVV